jgi:hypothetical protein
MTPRTKETIMDNYQAVYDAVRSRISGGNIADAVAQAVRDADISHHFLLAGNEMQYAAGAVRDAMTRPSVLYRPDLGLDGSKWCALYGSDLMNGVAGFGDTPADAMADFDRAWNEERTPVCRRRSAAGSEPVQGPFVPDDLPYGGEMGDDQQGGG